MIVLSLVLVIVAAVTLIAGFFQQDSLTLIWVSIGSCVIAMLFLGVGVLQRKRTTPATSGGYGPGAPVRPPAPSRPAPAAPAEATAADEPAADEDATTVIVRTASAGPQRVVAKKAVVRRPAGDAAAAKKASPSGRTTGAAARDVLAEIRGVGPAKQDALLQAFGSIEDLRAATPEEIATVRGVGPALARSIKDHLA